MDRAQPGARGSTNRNIEFGETTGQYTDGWIVPADEPTLSSQRYTSLDETAFNEFDATYSADSLTISIDPGEAFVDGWLARDVKTDIDLAADTNDQAVVLGWDPDAIYDDQQHASRDEADKTIVGIKNDVDPMHPTVEIWMFDTDANGVTNATDHRDIDPEFGENLVGRTAIDYRDIVVDTPNRVPIAELNHGESIELAIPVDDGETLEVYRWGAFDASDGMAPAGLDVQLLDGTDNVQATSGTSDEQDRYLPVASYKNNSGSMSVFNLRAKNDTGSVLDTPGVGSHFGYVVD
jgi:hypothetical protein